jgi:hypothetical protein
MGRPRCSGRPLRSCVPSEVVPSAALQGRAVKAGSPHGPGTIIGAMRALWMAVGLALLAGCPPRSRLGATVPQPAASSERGAQPPTASVPPAPSASARSAASVGAQPVAAPVGSDLPVRLPPVPSLPERRLEARPGVYTVWGASFSLRHVALRERVRGQVITVQGVIAKTNLEEAPSCAVHPPGIPDPEGCRAPVPAFWLCDAVGDALADCIEVMGWASNYAQLYAAIQLYRGAPTAERRDDFWGIAIPNPVPARGAIVTVTGGYDVTFTGASSGVTSDPTMGILTQRTITYERVPPVPARLPGMP